MNEREAARLIDYGQTGVIARDMDGREVERGVAVKVEMVPMLTLEHPDGTRASVPLEHVERA